MGNHGTAYNITRHHIPDDHCVVCTVLDSVITRHHIPDDHCVVCTVLDSVITRHHIPDDHRVVCTVLDSVITRHHIPDNHCVVCTVLDSIRFANLGIVSEVEISQVGTFFVNLTSVSIVIAKTKYSCFFTCNVILLIFIYENGTVTTSPWPFFADG